MSVSDEDDVADCVLAAVGLTLTDRLTELVVVVVPDRVFVAEAEAEEVLETVAAADAVPDVLPDGDAELLQLKLDDGDAEGVPDTVVVKLEETEEVVVLLTEGDTERVRVGGGEPETEGVAEVVAGIVADCDTRLAVTDTVTEGDGVKDREAGTASDTDNRLVPAGNQRLPSAPNAPACVMFAPTASDHIRLPLLLSAYIFPFAEPTYTVPSEPSTGPADTAPPVA